MDDYFKPWVIFYLRFWGFRIGILLLGCVLVYGLGNFLIAESPTITQTYGLTLEREDFIVSTAGVQSFSSQVATRGSTFALVFLNGELQTQESNPSTCGTSCADYSSVQIGGTNGKQVVTFLQALSVKDRVTLLYWR